MASRQTNPYTKKPIRSLGEFERVTRKVAGLPEHTSDNPERPFSPEYENPAGISAELDGSPVDVVEDADEGTQDTTPSADNRELYRQPAPAELHAERVKQVRERYIDPARAVVRAAHEKREAEAQNQGF